MQQLASRAYGEITHRTASEKQIEFVLFQQITDAMRAVAEADAPAPAVWADAIDRNLELWTLLSADLVSPENALPADTKRGLLQLAQFVRQTSFQVLAGEDGLADLIEVNSTIMQGLGGAGAAAEDTA